MRSYRSSSHTIYDLKVHLIWITKYRYKVLTKEVGYRTREIIRQVCDANNLEIIRGCVSILRV
ncbi:MAG: transposase [Desulfobacteria bacterium]